MVKSKLEVMAVAGSSHVLVFVSVFVLVFAFVFVFVFAIAFSSSIDHAGWCG